MNIINIWEKAQSFIKEEIGVPTFETWFSSIQVKEKDDTTLILETPDDFFKSWIIDHYHEIIKTNLTKASPESQLNVEFIVTEDPPPRSQTKIVEKKEKTISKQQSKNLNPRFSFDNFVVGPSNRFASAACLAVAESPAKAYNPLFIYGHVGLGKTHLMQAISHQIKLFHPDLACCYISSELFTNELIEAIRHRSTAAFRRKYRNIDILLIDDIHFIAGKESTQEEFFHTFNTLHNNRKQIIISSDRPPKEISNLEERLCSRFAWGLITDIQPPDFETRVAILRKKIEREPVHVPDNVLVFIAEHIKTNIRELEGALIRVVAYSLLEEKPVSLEMAKVILKDMVKETIKTISVEKIQKFVSAFFHVTLSDLKAKKRNKNIIIPRQIAMYLSRQLTNLSLPEIGKAFGGKDHTTVLHSCKKIEKNLLINEELKNTLEKLSMDLQH